MNINIKTIKPDQPFNCSRCNTDIKGLNYTYISFSKYKEMCIHIHITAVINYNSSFSKEVIPNKFLKEDVFVSLGNKKLFLDVENENVVNMLSYVGKSTCYVPILPIVYNTKNVNNISDIQVPSSDNGELKLHTESSFETIIFFQE